MRQMGNNRSTGMIIGLLIVVALAFFAFRSCNPSAGIPGTGGSGGTVGSGQQGQLGQVFAARQVSQNGCPQGTTNQFASTDTIYVGFTQSDIPQGTSIFARLLRGSQTLEDTNEITADRDMHSCIWFEFRPSQSSGGFQPGNYTAQLFVNGNPAGEVNFTVSDSGSGNGGIFGGSNNGGANNGANASAAQLGTLYTSTRVDKNGCPANSVSSFSPGDKVYVAFDQSSIPAGTKMFARLLRGGQSVEDTDVITAEREMNSCVWFVFEANQGSGGLQAGNYQAQIYMNGDMVDQIAFEVR